MIFLIVITALKTVETACNCMYSVRHSEIFWKQAKLCVSLKL